MIIDFTQLKTTLRFTKFTSLVSVNLMIMTLEWALEKH